MSALEVILPGQTVSLLPQSAGLAHGYAVFETLRYAGGRLEFWEAHWRRLHRAASKLGINCAIPEERVLGGLRSLAEVLPDEAVVKLSLLKEGEGEARLLVYSRTPGPVRGSVGLQLKSPFPVNEAAPLIGLKTHNYLENFMVLEAAHAVGCYDSARVNLRGFLAEGAISNLFFVKDGDWFTPDERHGLLAGVIRGALIGALPVEKGDFSPRDLLEADAVFLTNSSVGLLPVDWLRVDGATRMCSSRSNPAFSEASDLLEACREADSIALV